MNHELLTSKNHIIELVKCMIMWLITLGSTFSIQAQDYVVQSQFLSDYPSLSDRNISTIHQSPDGYIWVGTLFGLNRFDGYTFKEFKLRNQESFGISALDSDEQGRLWVRAYGYELPIYVIDNQSGEVLSIDEHYPTAERLIHLLPQQFTASPVLSSAHNDIYRYEQGKLRKILSLSGQSVDRLQFATDQLIWMIVKKGDNPDQLAIYGQDGQRLFNQPVEDLVHTLKQSPNAWKQLAIPSKPEVIQQMLAYYFPVELTAAASIGISSSYYDPLQNKIWLSNQQQLMTCYQWADEKWQQELQVKLPEQLQGNIHHVDWQGKIWTYGESLAVLTVQKRKFNQWLQDDGFSLRQLLVDRNKLYTTAYKGAQLVDLATDSATFLSDILIPQPATGVSQNYLEGLLKNGISIKKYQDHFLIGSTQLLAFNQQHQVRLIQFEPDYGNRVFINAMHERNDTLWLGTNANMYYLDQSSQKVKRVGHLDAKMNGGSAIINEIVKESATAFWICADNGLYLYDSGTGAVVRYFTGGTGHLSFPVNHILHLYKDADGIYWLATKGGGLIRWNRETQELQQFTTAQGLSHNVVYAVYEDANQHLWLPSNQGLMQFDKNSFEVKTYLPEDGLTHIEFNYKAHFQDQAGRLYFGGMNGGISFNPADFYRTKQVNPAPFKVIDLQVQDGRTGKFDDQTLVYHREKKLILKPENKVFSLKVSLLDYAKAEKHLYAFQLAGFHQDWQYQTDPVIRLGGLPYGAFILRIKAKGENNVWEDTVLEIPIEVQKPFYLSYWFIGSCVLLVIAFIRWRFDVLKQNKKKLEQLVSLRTEELQEQNYQIQQDKITIEQQAEELKALDDLKSRFFANVSHELRTPLTLITGLLKEVKSLVVHQQAQKDIEIIDRNSQKLKSLVEEILELSTLESKVIELKEQAVDINHHLHVLTSAFTSFTAYRNVEMRLSIEQAVEDKISLDIEKFDKIINNLLSNAIKFTPNGGHILVELKEFDGQLQVTVTDTGSGIAAKDLPYIFDRYYQTNQIDAPIQGGTGIGLALSKELAEILNGTLAVASDLGKGSCFSFTFPKKVAKPDFPDLDLDEEAMTLEEEQDAVTMSTVTGARIWLVEDHPDMQQYVQRILANYYQVRVLGNGKLALQTLQTTKEGDLPDLIISDVMMPMMDGFTLLDRVKADERLRHLPFVLLTARAASEDKLRGLRMGVNDYLLKPFIKEELIARVHNLITFKTQRVHWLKEDTHAQVAEKLQQEQPKLQLSQADEEWLQKLETATRKLIDQRLINISNLAEQMAVSERQLYRKVKQFIGLSPNKYIQEIRLQIARKYLEEKKYASMKEVAYEVGFKNYSHFSTLYQKRFGKSPQDYLRQVLMN